MSIRFLADADLNYAIVTGVRLREPRIDFASAAEFALEGVGDPQVLDLAALEGRILVSHDLSSMPKHLASRRHTHREPGCAPGFPRGAGAGRD